MTKKILFIIISCLMLAGCNQKTTDVSEGTVVDVQRAQAEMAKIYNNIDELLADSNNVVLGECTKLESFIEDDGVIWTKETFHVDETLFGDINNDEDIIIYIMGGNITVKDYLSSYNGAFKDQLENRYKDCNDDDLISFVSGEDRLPVKGEKVFYSLLTVHCMMDIRV